MSAHDDKTAISSRGRVVVVDPDEGHRRQLTLRLEENLFDVRAYASGDDCLAKAGDFDPDVILLDLGSIETCRLLKQRTDLASIPVVFVTAPRDDEATAILALAAGGNDFLAHDASQPVIIARLGSQITLRRTQRQLQKLAASA